MRTRFSDGSDAAPEGVVRVARSVYLPRSRTRSDDEIFLSESEHCLRGEVHARTVVDELDDVTRTAVAITKHCNRRSESSKISYELQ